MLDFDCIGSSTLLSTFDGFLEISLLVAVAVTTSSCELISWLERVLSLGGSGRFTTTEDFEKPSNRNIYILLIL